MLVYLLGEGVAFRRELKVDFQPGDPFLGDHIFAEGNDMGSASQLASRKTCMHESNHFNW